MDISHLLSQDMLDLYEKNREFIESNPDYKVEYPKGEIILSDDTKPENLFEKNSKAVKLVENTIPSKEIDIEKHNKEE